MKLSREKQLKYLNNPDYIVARSLISSNYSDEPPLENGALFYLKNYSDMTWCDNPCKEVLVTLKLQEL